MYLLCGIRLIRLPPTASPIEDRLVCQHVLQQYPEEDYTIVYGDDDELSAVLHELMMGGGEPRILLQKRESLHDLTDLFTTSSYFEVRKLLRQLVPRHMVLNHLTSAVER